MQVLTHMHARTHPYKQTHMDACTQTRKYAHAYLLTA